MAGHPEYIPKRTLNSGCGFCESKTSLFHCADCKVMLYCSREHQAAHRDEHKAACNNIKKAYAKADCEEAKLRALPPSLMHPANVFEEQVGHFWGLVKTRDYIRSRHGVFDALGGVLTQVAVQAKLDTVKDIMRLNRSDNMGVRDFAPLLMMRLDFDQEAYNFMKWSAWVNDQSHYDRGDMSAPFLHFKDEDVFEDVDIFCTGFGDLTFLVAVLILKFKFMRDLKALHDSAEISDRVPIEIHEQIRRNIPFSSLIANNPKIITDLKYADQLGAKMFAQTKVLIHAIHSANQHYFPHLIDPVRSGVLETQPEYMSRGTHEEMCIVMQQSYEAWVETPDAISYVLKLFTENELGAPGNRPPGVYPDAVVC
jgi:hypothetical protein